MDPLRQKDRRRKKKECTAVPRLQQEKAALPGALTLLLLPLLPQLLLLGRKYPTCCSSLSSGHRISDASPLHERPLADTPVHGSAVP